MDVFSEFFNLVLFSKDIEPRHGRGFFSSFRVVSLKFKVEEIIKKQPYLLQNANNLSKKTRLGNNVHFRDRIPKDFTSGIVYKFQCGFLNESYYGE